MESTKAMTKEKKLKIALFAVAILLLVVIAYLLVMKNGGAWLVDRGEWSNASYTIGRIDYTYELNGAEIPFPVDDTMLSATVPIIGGVKLNDQSGTTGVANYEKNANENFNDGVTVAHIEIRNKGDFNITLNYTLVLDKMAEDEINPQDVFCMVLPQGATVDSVNKTIAVKGATAVSYKEYIKEALGNPNGYTEMTAALKKYYSDNPTLKTPSATIINKNEVKETNILFWCEYNNNLPFVTTIDGKDVLRPSNEAVKPLTATFTVKFQHVEQVAPTSQAVQP